MPLAKAAGARVVIVNAEPTPFDDIADAVLREPIGERPPEDCFMTITPLLAFRGDCQDAFSLYERAFGGTIVTMLTYAAAGQDTVPPDWREKIFHATLTDWRRHPDGRRSACRSSTSRRRGSSSRSASPIRRRPTASIGALAEHGTVKMPLQETFWAARFGVVVDRFGIPWIINCEAPH